MSTTLYLLASRYASLPAPWISYHGAGFFIPACRS